MLIRMSYGGGRKCGRGLDPHDDSISEDTKVEMLTRPPALNLRGASCGINIARLVAGEYDLTPPNATAIHRLEVFENGSGRYTLTPQHAGPDGLIVPNIVELPQDRTSIAVTEGPIGKLVLFHTISYRPGSSPLPSPPIEYDDDDDMWVDPGENSGWLDDDPPPPSSRL